MNTVEKAFKSLNSNWSKILEEELQKPYFTKIIELLSIENNTNKIYPKQDDIFKCLELTPFSKVKVVIIGQDPYHGPGQANGLAFSVNKGISIPPSLKNIYKELKRDLKIEFPSHGNLEKWANQGVLLINSTLTVRAGSPNSHEHFGWSYFTDAIIKIVSNKKSGIVFLLWGNFAQKKQHLIDNSKHYVLTTSHPSPLSAHRGFLGSNHFSETNRILKQQNINPIDWNIS